MTRSLSCFTRPLAAKSEMGRVGNMALSGDVLMIDACMHTLEISIQCNIVIRVEAAVSPAFFVSVETCLAGRGAAVVVREGKRTERMNLLYGQLSNWRIRENSTLCQCTRLFYRIPRNSVFDIVFGSEKRNLFGLNLMPLSYEEDVVNKLNIYRLLSSTYSE